MVFSSLVFLFYFFPIFFIGYSLTPNKWKNLAILFASLVFYAWGAPQFFEIILGSAILNFVIVNRLHSSENIKLRKRLLALSIVINLGLLLYYKYTNFFLENVNHLLSFSGKEQIKWTEILLPIGISFYTFQTLTYSIDVYRKVHQPLSRLVDYLVYIFSFPQLIAGPIVRFHEIADQLGLRNNSIENRLIGFYRFAIGLAKKVLIANVLAHYADDVFDNDFSLYSSTALWAAILAYTFQIYFDFSGYSDMAIGLGRMMGFTFPENFNFPYISKSITEFWRRWHITLGNFMREYLYIPLGGNQTKTKSRMYFNLVFVFFISGLWHGASWNFIIWGLYHGFFLIIERVFLRKWLDKLPSFLQITWTFFVVIIGWVFFRLTSFEDINLFFKLILKNNHTGYTFSSELIMYLILAVLFSFMGSFKRIEKFSNQLFKSEEWYLKKHFILFFITGLLFYLSIVSLASSNFNPFIYFRF